MTPGAAPAILRAVSDANLRDLERKAATGDVASAARLLQERVRAGEPSEERLRLAAYCGHAGARAALGADGSGRLRVSDPTTWELWREGAGMHSFFPSDNGSARDMLDQHAERLWTIEIDACRGRLCDGGRQPRPVCFACWCAAMQAKNDFLGFGPYDPPEPW